MQDHFIKNLQSKIDDIRSQIINHEVYQLINDIDAVKVFMEHHIYAVWDFMSLLKSLQRNLTCVDVPWMPVGDAETRYLINEIVAGEESDVDMDGKRLSHFELYLNAMQQTEADTTKIASYLQALKASGNHDKAFATAHVPAAAQQFINNTFDVIDSGKLHVQAAVFTYGREDLIPNMFYSMVNDIESRLTTNSISIFKYYLERHIEVDGDHHSHLAAQMTANLCGNDAVKWAEAEEAVLQSLACRVALWDGVAARLKERELV